MAVRRGRVGSSLLAVLVATAALAGASAFAAPPTAAAATAATPATAATAPFTRGDLFLSIGLGKVEERTPSGALVQTLFMGGSNGSAFDKNQNLYVTDANANAVAEWDRARNFALFFGATYDSGPSSIEFDAAGDAFVGESQFRHSLLKLNPAGQVVRTYQPAIEDGGVNWIDLAADNCTMQYTSVGRSLKQFDVCRNRQLPDFSTSLPARSYAHRLLPDGTVLVASTSVAVRLDATGAVMKTYTPAEPVPGTLVALTLDPDGKSFWTADQLSGLVVRFDIATGAELSHFSPAPFWVGVGGISIIGEPTAVPKLALAPESSTTAGTQHTVTATAGDGGLPAANTTVTFTVVSGPNAGHSGTATTNGSGVATFTFSSIETGTDTIQASFVSKSGVTVTSNTVTKTWGEGTHDHIAPSCIRTTVWSGTPTTVDLAAQDGGSGLGSVVATRHRNASVSVPNFAPGHLGEVVIRSTRVDESRPLRVTLRVKDVAGNIATCEAALGTLTAGPRTLRFLQLDGADRFVSVTNGTPGLHGVLVAVNGHWFGTALTPGERRVLDVGSAMLPGHGNRMRLFGFGQGTADVLVSNGS